MKKSSLEVIARELRRDAISMLYRAQSGHPGSAMSMMDIITVLYYGGVMTHSPELFSGVDRDYFLLSNGHAAPALYVALARAGYFDSSFLQTLRQLNSPTQGHPHRGSLPGIEISSGSLGQGLSVGIGLAYAHRLAKRKRYVFVSMSDGEQEEGSTWEAVMLAPKLELSGLIAVIDKNKFQIDGATADVMPGLDPLADKYRAFHWNVKEIDGHDMSQLLDAFAWAKQLQGPSVIIANTVRGKGVSFMEDSEHWHAGAISDDQFAQAQKDLS